ncbi:DsbA family protein [Reichenbachiella sp. MALMAid0571]|uniref:DsbA family protein n=1 Tax=Reichenbachiella sp. MALMAid0571 TaxID=3143939 RepID=UPI0032DE5EDF
MDSQKDIKCDDGVCITPDIEEMDNNIETEDSQGKLIYFGDPMCSWCWGITNHLEQLKNEFDGKLEFGMVMGGLRPGGGELWNSEMKAFLREHWEHVEQASGQPFNYGLLDWDEFDYDTEPPARAVRVIRDIKPDQELEFYKSVQYAFYVLNHDPGKKEFYQPLCEQIGVSFDTFIALFNSDGYKKLVRQDFVYAQQLGVRGFPSVVLQQRDKLTAISRGYATFEAMKTRVEELLTD